MQVANYLGLVESHLKRLNKQPKKDSSLYKFGFWFFEEQWTNTPQGEKLWADYKLPTQETVVPLARKEFINVTGMTKIGESQTGVEFTWRWVPNELGKALDPASEEFKALPANMRKNLTDNVYKVSPNLTYSWGGDRTGRAIFQKYDDGWRLVSVRF